MLKKAVFLQSFSLKMVGLLQVELPTFTPAGFYFYMFVISIL